MDLAKMTPDDLKSFIRDSVRASLAEGMTVSVDKATEAADRAKREGSHLDMLARIVAGASEEARAGGNYPRAIVDMRLGTIITDPHKGRGLELARAVKAMLVGKMENRDAKDVAQSWFKAGHRHYEPVADTIEPIKRAMSESVAASGGLLVAPQIGEFIELLYAVTLAYRLGARDYEFNRQVDFGKMTAGVTAYYGGELALMVPSTPSVGQVKMSAKKAYAITLLSNEILRNPSVSSDALVRDDMLKAIALKRDSSFYRGTGTEYAPKGWKNWIKSANKNGQSGTALANKVSDLIKAISLVDESNIDLEMNRGAFAMAPRSKWALAATLDSQGNFVFAAMLASGQLFGFPIGTTTQIPTNLGGGTNESEIYFGVHNDVFLGRDSTQPLQVEVFPNGAVHDGSAVVSGISTDQSAIRALEAHDVAARHDNTGAMVTGVTWTV